jgi:BirA family biotin operon repressor/biotin-[acetyl-CoA-carboxylase] ligase
MDLNILLYDTLDSTNSEAARQARLGAAEGTCVIARQQTAGRGRYGRTWSSEKDAGLYFSVILRPTMEIGFLPLISLMAGVAVYETLADLGLEPDIKWVNDVLVGEKKISGILSEAIETPAGHAVIVGIGINLNLIGLGDDLRDTSTSIESESGTRHSQDDIARRLTSQLSRLYDILRQNDGQARILELWRHRSTYFSGKQVRVAVENEIIDGTTEGLENNGALRLRLADGSLKVIQAGDVQRLRSDTH